MVFKFRKICPTGNLWNHLLFTGQKSPASQAVASSRIAPKICQGQPPTIYPECSRFHPNRFTFGGVIAECLNTAKLPCRVYPIFGGSLASILVTRPTCYPESWEIYRCICLQQKCWTTQKLKVNMRLYVLCSRPICRFSLRNNIAYNRQIAKLFRMLVLKLNVCSSHTSMSRIGVHTVDVWPGASSRCIRSMIETSDQCRPNELN